MRPAVAAALVVAAASLLGAPGCGPEDEQPRTGDRAPASANGSGRAGGPVRRGNLLSLRVVARGLDRPLGLVPAPGSGELHVVGQGGRIVALDRRGRPHRALIDLEDRVVSGGEQGLLGLAFHPRYPRNGRFFVHYTNREGDTRVDEYRARAGVADPRTRRELLAVEQPFPNHNGEPAVVRARRPPVCGPWGRRGRPRPP